MKRIWALVLLICVLMGVGATAAGEANAQERVNFFDLIGMTEKEAINYLYKSLEDAEYTSIDRAYSNLTFSKYLKDGVSEKVVSGFKTNGYFETFNQIIGVYDLNYDAYFDGELSGEMVADGWKLAGREFVGKYCKFKLECVDDGVVKYSMVVQTTGANVLVTANNFRIHYVDFEVLDMEKHFEPKDAEEADSGMTDWICDGCGAAIKIPFVPRGDRPVYCEDCFNAR